MAQPFHAGELSVQSRVGESEQARRNGSVIARSIRPGVLPFIQDQRMAFIGSVDTQGDVWASAVFGSTGLVHAINPQAVELDLVNAAISPSDPLWVNVRRDPRIGMLLIEFETRRRVRINGRAWFAREHVLRLEVDEAYANCPKYIQRRHLDAGQAERVEFEIRQGADLDKDIVDVVSASDTFFVASMAPQGSLDVSHRGGPPGFARWLDGRTLRIPDYPGNSMYNTLGNLEAYPRAGLLFIDFDNHRTVQLTGAAKIRWDLATPTAETGGTGRYWDFVVDRWIETSLSPAARWTYVDASPFNPAIPIAS